LAAALPVIVLASALPVPLMAAVPVSTRSSTFEPSVWEMLDCTVSWPSSVSSVTTSPALSTT
jgi:hypothetical protein